MPPRTRYNTESDCPPSLYGDLYSGRSKGEYQGFSKGKDKSKGGYQGFSKGFQERGKGKGAASYYMQNHASSSRDDQPFRQNIVQPGLATAPGRSRWSEADPRERTSIHPWHGVVRPQSQPITTLPPKAVSYSRQGSGASSSSTPLPGAKASPAKEKKPLAFKKPFSPSTVRCKDWLEAYVREKRGPAEEPKLAQMSWGERIKKIPLQWGFMLERQNNNKTGAASSSSSNPTTLFEATISIEELANANQLLDRLVQELTSRGHKKRVTDNGMQKTLPLETRPVDLKENMCFLYYGLGCMILEDAQKAWIAAVKASRCARGVRLARRKMVLQQNSPDLCQKEVALYQTLKNHPNELDWDWLPSRLSSNVTQDSLLPPWIKLAKLVQQSIIAMRRATEKFRACHQIGKKLRQQWLGRGCGTTLECQRFERMIENLPSLALETERYAKDAERSSEAAAHWFKSAFVDSRQIVETPKKDLDEQLDQDALFSEIVKKQIKAMEQEQTEKNFPR